MRTPHTSCQRGKRVKIVLKNGDEFIAKFSESKGRYVYLDGGNKRVQRGQIKKFTILKGGKERK